MIKRCCEDIKYYEDEIMPNREGTFDFGINGFIKINKLGLDKETMIELNEIFSDRDLSNLANVTPRTIRKWRNTDFNLTRSRAPSRKTLIDLNLKYTQKELAELYGVSRTTIRNWYSQRNVNPISHNPQKTKLDSRQIIELVFDLNTLDEISEIIGISKNKLYVRIRNITDSGRERQKIHQTMWGMSRFKTEGRKQIYYNIKILPMIHELRLKHLGPDYNDNFTFKNHDTTSFTSK